MKKFIFSIVLFFSGILLICSTIIAEGLIIAGNNAGIPGYFGKLFGSNDNPSNVFLTAGIIIALIGLILMLICIFKDKHND